MIKLLSLFVIIGVVSGCTDNKRLEDVVIALKGIEAKIEVGVTYQRYLDMVGETNIKVKDFFESSSSSKRPEITRLIRSIMYHHLSALNLWRMAIKYDNDLFLSQEYNPNPDHESYNNMKRQLFEDYPEAVQEMKIHKGITTIPMIYSDTLLKIIWNKAKIDLDKLSKLL
jgi:hypothetical protein